MQDLILNNGDLQLPLVRSESTAQHQQLLLVCAKAEFKESPLATVGLMHYLESENQNLMLSEIRKCFVADGMTVNKIEIKNGEIVIDAKYSS